ncbi:MAG: hypothetical protein Cons2KO_13510 [Congregibacter sp.]
MNAPESNSAALCLADSNVRFLKQGRALLEDLSDDEYVRAFPPTFSQGIGAHVRHIVDHYRCLLEGVSAGSVDYDARERSLTVETDRRAALEALEAIVLRLHGLGPADGEFPCVVVMDCGDGRSPVRLPGRSTLARELQFLVSHTVHHYAMVSVMLRMLGREPAIGFGIAPSTQRHLAG